MTALREFIERHQRLVVLTGAGVSTGSGIPDYRDEQGAWKRARPVEGEPVPRERVTRAFDSVANADALLVVGTSLMVYSGFRFAEAAAAAGKPVAAVNLGRTRADHLLTLKISASCEDALTGLLRTSSSLRP